MRAPGRSELRLPFFGLGFTGKDSCFSIAASLSFQRRICSSLILKNRICFCSSFSSASRSGSMYISDRICFSIFVGLESFTPGAKVLENGFQGCLPWAGTGGAPTDLPGRSWGWDDSSSANWLWAPTPGSLSKTPLMNLQRATAKMQPC